MSQLSDEGGEHYGKEKKEEDKEQEEKEIGALVGPV